MRILSLILAICLCAAGLQAAPPDYTWRTPSANSAGSMPCGGGSIGMNVWAEDGDVLFYFSRSGMYDENNTLLKGGRIRISCPGRDITKDFAQTLKVADGYVTVAFDGVEIMLWADVFRSVIHVEGKSAVPVDWQVAYESWRYQDRPFRKGEGQQSSYKWSSDKGLYTAADTVLTTPQGLLFYHRNKPETVFDRTVTAERLDSVKHKLWNPIANLISGGLLTGKNLTFKGVSEGEYAGTDFRAWNFASRKPSKALDFTIALHSEQTTDVATWEKGVENTLAQADTKRDRQASRKWWNEFWERSHITSGADAGSTDADMLRNYTLFRYMLGCNAFGSEPTKFNGGLFTFDPVYVDGSKAFTPDYRTWGGGTMTAQNQRLVYWPMLATGDTDMMTPQFDFYHRILPVAELRSQVYWGHPGACYTEQIEQFGLPNMMEYGLKRPATFDPGVEYNAWLEYEWDTVLEFCQMILDTQRYTGKVMEAYYPMIESVITFFDEHYRQKASQRGRKALDGDGKLVIYPGSACETYKMTTNSASTVSALRRVLTSYIDVLPDSASAAKWTEILSRIPELPLRTVDGRTMIAPAKCWERINNIETPQLYPVFPWRFYGMAVSDSADLQLARDTYLHDPDAVRFRESKGWKQDNIWAASLGLTEDAYRLTSAKLADGPYRFPAFWPPGYDWAPDHNLGGSAMLGVQEMLMQTSGDKILLFPAWPRDKDVSFKLHAPGNTVVEATLAGGAVKDLKVTPASRLNDVIINPSWK